MNADDRDLLDGLMDENNALRRALRMLIEALDCSPVATDWEDAPEVVEARAVLGR